MNFMTDDEIISGKSSEVLTTVDTRAERLAICNTCPEKDTVAGFSVCSRCNCILGFKTFFKLAPCPLNKWIIPVEQLPVAE